MCGICGIFTHDLRSIGSDRVLAMRDEMVNRGPDGEGIAMGKGFGLGHRRLSIIDLSDAGRQPMSNEDGSILIVHNGEIYNFNGLRSQLEGKGHRFRSRTDTEVLIHGYEEWGGLGLLERIRGMFAFAIVDAKRRELFLARDPVGKKPLFYAQGPGEVLFASTTGSLLAGLRDVPEIRPEAVDKLFMNLYIPGPGTIFKGVMKLGAGAYLKCDAQGDVKTGVHWQPDFSASDESLNFAEWIDKTEEYLTEAVTRRLVADVPVGVLLSGGVDSSLVAAIASKMKGGVKTFSVATEDPEWDESVYAEQVASHLDAVHQTLRVDDTVVGNGLDELIQGMGEPLADPSLLNVFAISKLARTEVTVVLTGDGGDEVYGGYQQYLACHTADKLRPFLRHLPARGLTQFLLGSQGALRKGGTLLRLASDPVEVTIKDGVNLSFRDSLYSSSFLERLNGCDPGDHLVYALPDYDTKHDVSRVMTARMKTVLVDDYLQKVDFGSMSVSLESRSPLLDLDLINMAQEIPADLLFKRWKKKAVLKALARRMVPAECVDRPKMGFRAPVGRWLESTWKKRVEDYVMDEAVLKREWLDPNAARNLLARSSRTVQENYFLWAVFLLVAWLEHHSGRTFKPA